MSSFAFPPDYFSPSPSPSSSFPFSNSPDFLDSIGIIIGIVIAVIIFLVVYVVTCRLLCCAKSTTKMAEEKKMDAKKTDALEDVESQLIPPAMVQFLDDMERAKPIQFTSEQLRIYTGNFSIILGSGGFGIVYKGIIGINKYVAVKVLTGTSNQQIEEQFMVEVSTMGRIHHLNLVRLYGFCFEPSLIALVYEFMVNGSLDNHLFKADKGATLGFDKLQEIALGTARGIRYLHEECAQRIVHYDIKPGNILLDSNFCAKVADFGLAKLCNREKTHISMTRGRGTPGYAAPELWMPFPIAHKCDVYSFGMLLFEIIGRRRNMDITLGDSQQWFPVFAWDKCEKNQMEDLMINCEIEEKDYEVVARMLKVAFCCVQYRPENRPTMSMIVKMLEGELEVRPLNHFTHLISGANEPNVSLN
ncbi:G-type lectin S-receptor-like serine/threonine-protein kinase At1g34300 [Bidens hawaiensis]|uniref:G-type lectin S-receptor-like serine/threonine-protein kinase At1g34300 n=1 Tax=Bidens hawaiensis TaxID=980011 RepID=UPI00404B9E64